jgi:D-amino-acid dehydrogenase
VIASGSWSRDLAAKLDLKLPLMPGRGYSITLDNPGYSFNHPAILVERRVAITPLSENKLRFGGTMEITATNTPPKWKRVQGIIESVNHYFPEIAVTIGREHAIWYGYRPCSADGLPYIGRLSKFSNCILATGHSMLGLSLGPGTGKLVAELVNEIKSSIDISAFNPERFD